MLHEIRFTMHGRPCVVTADRQIAYDEFLSMLYYTRRLMGYVIYPRWCAARLLLAETIEMMRRNGIYRRDLKYATKQLLTTFDQFERLHQSDFDLEFISLIGDGLAAGALGIINEMRGAIGSAMLNQGVKRYVLLSYPYTVLDLAYDNNITYDKAMEAVRTRYGIDFSKTFRKYKGERLYNVTKTWMDVFVDTLKEEIPRLQWDGSLAQQKLTKFEAYIIDEENIHKAFREAYDEMPDDKKPALEAVMSIWDKDNDKVEIQRSIEEILADKYKVTKAKDNGNKKKTKDESERDKRRRVVCATRKDAKDVQERNIPAQG